MNENEALLSIRASRGLYWSVLIQIIKLHPQRGELIARIRKVADGSEDALLPLEVPDELGPLIRTQALALIQAVAMP